MKRLTLAVVLVIGAAVALAAQSTRTPLTIDDLVWKGTYKFPPMGDATPGGPGTTSYASGALAVRYVGGQRRLLMPTFTQLDTNSGQQFGDLVEWAAPAALPSVDPDHTKAPALVEVRRWKKWTILANTPSWQEKTSGVRVGGLLWDESTGVLWYQLYGYYSSYNAPVLGATKLNDDGSVGAQYGPWWYRSADGSDRTNLYWKAVCNWLVKVPASSQADLQGSTLIMGGTVGAVGGAGNLGPGFRALPSLPSLSDAPNTILPLGLRLADYTGESPVTPPHAHRDTNYQFDGVPYTASESGLYPPNSTYGFWQMSLDQVNSFIWVETSTKEGILLFGREATGMHWYGYNPRSTTPGYPVGWPDATDPSREIGPGNGYGAAGWKGGLYVFDPAQVREVGRGARLPWSSGINSVAYDWRAKWPAMPYVPGRFISSQISNTGFWDATAQEILWIQPESVSDTSPQPTLNIFGVGDGTTPTPDPTPTPVPDPTFVADPNPIASGTSSKLTLTVYSSDVHMVKFGDIIPQWSAVNGVTTAVAQTPNLTATTTYQATAFHEDGTTPWVLPAVTVTVNAAPPPPPPSTGSMTGVISSCSFKLDGIPPDTTGGWSAQFKANGSKVGSVDSSAPFSRTLTFKPGSYAFSVMWSKTGVTSVTATGPTLTCQ